MSHFHRVISLRTALLGLGLGLTLAVPAHAALAGAPPLTSTTRPDLRSTTLDGSTARWCFDKSLDASSLSSRDFALGGYRSGPLSPRPTSLRIVDAPRPGLGRSCAAGTFAASAGDLRSYTVGLVGEGVVAAFGGRAGNRADSTALDGSDSRSGSRGFTAGPDLVGVSVDAGGNALSFAFDQAVGAIGDAASFHFYGSDGARRDALGVRASGRVVRAQFAAPAGVGSAARGFVDAGAVTDASAGATPNPLGSAVVPGAPGDIARPELRSAAFSPGGDFVDFAYATPTGIAAADPQIDPSVFRAYLADGSVLRGTTAAAVGPAAVRVGFPATVFTREYLVSVSADEGALADPDTHLASAVGDAPLGGNPEARAGGYTTAPDAVAVVFDRTHGTATVTFDQSIFATEPSGFRLLDAAGSDIGAAATSAPVPVFYGPDPRVVRVRFTPRQIASARALEIRGYLPASTCSAGVCGRPSVTTALSGRDAGNVQQILSPGR